MSASELLKEFKRANDAFLELECCGEIIGLVNSRMFTPEASKRFSEIFDRLGNEWPKDPEAQAMLLNQDAHAAPVDGTPIDMDCDVCGAKFVWAGGIPMKVKGSS